MASVSGSHRLLCAGKREIASCDAIAPAMRRNVWKGETESRVDGTMLQTSLPPRSKEDLLCPSFTRSRRKDKCCIVTKAKSSAVEHLSSLNSYFEKLHNCAKQPSSRISKGRIESIGKVHELEMEDGLRSLENYLVKVKDVESQSEDYKDIKASVVTSTKKDRGIVERSLKNVIELQSEKTEGKETSSDETSDFYLIGALVSINIAVFLFEIATPIKSSDFELFSLPTVYGAKINNLILTGEWWRLVTPIFLHSGILHIALGSWALFTFGLEVSKRYGSFTFLPLYVLGGISGNLISFLHTPEPSVGGTVHPSCRL